MVKIKTKRECVKNEDEWDVKAVRLVTASNTKASDVEIFLDRIKQSN